MPANPYEPPKRRWFQFGPAAMFIVALLAGLLLVAMSAIWLILLWFKTLPAMGITVPPNRITWQTAQWPIALGSCGMIAVLAAMYGGLWHAFRRR